MIEKLSEEADLKSVKSMGKYKAYSFIFKNKSFQELEAVVEEMLKKPALNGELIKCNVSEGKLIDMGEEMLRIVNGLCVEFYSYEELSLYFLRLYWFKDGSREWVSLYIDENPETPWWSLEERGFEKRESK